MDWYRVREYARSGIRPEPKCAATHRYRLERAKLLDRQDQAVSHTPQQTTRGRTAGLVYRLTGGREIQRTWDRVAHPHESNLESGK